MVALVGFLYVDIYFFVDIALLVTHWDKQLIFSHINIHHQKQCNTDGCDLWDMEKVALAKIRIRQIFS